MLFNREDYKDGQVKILYLEGSTLKCPYCSRTLYKIINVKQSTDFCGKCGEQFEWKINGVRKVAV